MANELEDAVRELMKAKAVLEKVDRAFTAEGEMNATKHLSEQVLVHPLGSAVKIALSDIGKAIARLWESPEEDDEEDPPEVLVRVDKETGDVIISRPGRSAFSVEPRNQEKEEG